MLSAEAIHEALLVIDGHADTPQRFVDEGWSFSDPRGSGMLDLASARAGNLAAEFFAIWAEPKEWRGRYAFRTLQLIDGVLEQVRKHPGRMRLGATSDDILQAHADGVFCALMGIEGGHSIENSLALLRLYYQLGVRYMTLTWSNTNEWADSSGDLDDPAVQHHGGLTDFGRQVVVEMNRLGMMVDIAHVSDETFWDVLRTTHAPIIASHSSARALTASPRNLTDEQLRAMATNDGIVMVNFYPPFIDEAWRTTWQAARPQRDALLASAAAEYLQAGQPVPYAVSLAADRAFYATALKETLPLPPMSALVDHIDHVVQVAGVDHVGIGSDFDGIQFLPEGMESAADLPSITAALLGRGYTEEQLRKIMGGNLLRVFRAVEEHALQAAAKPVHP
jgi:membrane dipeptidase